MVKLKAINLIETYRKREGLSRTAFCKRCQIGLDVLKKIEEGKLNFRINSALKIIKVLKVDFNEFLAEIS